jgi:hypothetical protein
MLEGRWGDGPSSLGLVEHGQMPSLAVALATPRPGEQAPTSDSHQGPGLCDTLTHVDSKKQWGVGASGRQAWLT